MRVQRICLFHLGTWEVDAAIDSNVGTFVVVHVSFQTIAIFCMLETASNTPGYTIRMIDFELSASRITRIRSHVVDCSKARSGLCCYIR